MLQKPNSTHVAGFNTWKELGRWVKSGEKGISILAPVFPPAAKCEKCGARLPRNAKFCSKCGESIDSGDEQATNPRYFRVVYVFDISQTEGKPLSEFEVPALTGDANEELFSQALVLAKDQNLTVSFESKPETDPDIKGYYSGKSIWVRPEESRAQQLKTLLHEMAHYYTEGVMGIPRKYAETIAESAAFAVGARYGFDSGVRSFPYVAVWSQEKKVLEENLAAIRKVTGKIIESLGQLPQAPGGEV
jgi:predicted nucleic acid-binding Zn ribbon protein